MSDSHRDDPILDAFLDEVLGGAAPPDLTGRIMQTLAARRGDSTQSDGASADPSPADSVLAGLPQPPAPPLAEPAPPPVQRPWQDVTTAGGPRESGPAITTNSPRKRTRGRRRSSWQPWLVSAGLILMSAAIGVTAVWLARQSPDAVVDRDPGPTTDGPPSLPGPNDIAQPRAPRPSTPAPPEDPGLAVRQGDDDDDNGPDKPFNTPPPFVKPDDPQIADNQRPRPLPAARSDVEVVSFINTSLEASWSENSVEPAAAATDEEWCRRAFLRLLGRIPTVEELRAFVEDTGESKREQLVDRLLFEERYADELAAYWSGYLTNVLLGRRGGMRADGGRSRLALQQYLQQAIREDRPYNELAYELVAATGSSDPQAKDYNGAVHFLLSSADDKSVLATTRTSRAFLGLQMQCVQCHNHPHESWAQNRFWELNSFFRQMRVERSGGAPRLVNRDFDGEGRRKSPDEAEVYYERLDGKLHAAYPAFPGAPPLSPSGRLEDIDRRTELARLISESELLSRAVVNRVWSHFFGHGFTRPVDDMRPGNQPSHPQLLSGVSEQFAAHGYKLKTLLGWIAKSEAFGFSSRVPEGTAQLADAPERGTSPLFSRYYTRQLPPEEVYESLSLVARAHSSDPATRQQARLTWLGQFSRDMGTDEGDETNSFQGDIQRSLIIMNGPLMRQATTPRKGSVLHRVLQSKMSLTEKLDHLFLAALARKPQPRERQLIGKLVKDKSSDAVAAALQDIWWALLNSNEFILDH